MKPFTVSSGLMEWIFSNSINPGVVFSLLDVACLIRLSSSYFSPYLSPTFRQFFINPSLEWLLIRAAIENAKSVEMSFNKRLFGMIAIDGV